MKTNTYIIGVAVILAFACIGLGWWAYELRSQLAEALSREEDLSGRNSDLAAQLGELDRDLADRRNRAETLAGELAETEENLRKLAQEKSAAETAQEKLAQQMNAALAEQEVTISRLQGQLTVNILDRVMFDSGKAELKPEGKELLLKVAEVLAGIPDQQVLVIGHTDNIPVTASRHLYATNWELSAARATAAVRFLCETGQVDPRRIGALGYGEHHPIADNATRQGRAKNRRIEVVILDHGVLEMAH